MSAPLRIVVTGLAGTYPFGGVFWDYLLYALGFHRMGHEVLYLEDTGQWCYEPGSQTFVESGRANAMRLHANLARLEPALADRWFMRDAAGKEYGMPWSRVVEFCRSADLFLHVSASCWMRDEYFAAKKVAFLDSDPIYTQASVPGYLRGQVDMAERSRVDMLRAHDVHFTFAENIGGDDCLVPTELFDWQVTRQPVVVDALADLRVPHGQRRAAFTTVASWEPNLDAGPQVDGKQYKGKSAEFLRFLDLPRRAPLPLEIALSGKAPRDRLIRHGWHVVPGEKASADPWRYADYLARSHAEWSVAKNAYVESRSGWLSCRSACYLALGVPVVVQDTGAGDALPTGEGWLTFRNVDEAVAAMEAVTAEPERHARAAEALAREHFGHEKVLGSLLERALSATRSPRRPRRTTNGEAGVAANNA